MAPGAESGSLDSFLDRTRFELASGNQPGSRAAASAGKAQTAEIHPDNIGHDAVPQGQTGLITDQLASLLAQAQTAAQAQAGNANQASANREKLVAQQVMAQVVAQAHDHDNKAKAGAKKRAEVIAKQRSPHGLSAGKEVATAGGAGTAA